MNNKGIHSTTPDRRNEIPDLIKEISEFAKGEGYTVEEVFESDYGQTVKLILRKGDKKYILPLREYFYDTDSRGEITKIHGVIDIRETPWYCSSSIKKGLTD